MPIELDGVTESEASPVFERSVESPEKTPRTIRSIDALAEAYKNASPSKQPFPQTRKTTASTLSKCPSDMKLLCRQPSNRSEGDTTTPSESCSFVLPLRAKQQPKANWIGSPTGSQSHSQGHGTRAERQSISMSIDDSSMVVERDTVSGTMTPTTTAEAVSPQSDGSGLMGSKTEFQLRCSERNMRYNALHNDDFDISTQSNVQKNSVQLPEYGNAFPYRDDVSGDSDKENDPRSGTFDQADGKSSLANAEQTGLWGWTPSATQATAGVSDEEELHSGLEVDLRGSRFAFLGRGGNNGF